MDGQRGPEYTRVVRAADCSSWVARSALKPQSKGHGVGLPPQSLFPRKLGSFDKQVLCLGFKIITKALAHF